VRAIHLQVRGSQFLGNSQSAYFGWSFHSFGAVISAKLPMVDGVDVVFSQVTAPPRQLEGVGAL